MCVCVFSFRLIEVCDVYLRSIYTSSEESIVQKSKRKNQSDDGFIRSKTKNKKAAWAKVVPIEYIFTRSSYITAKNKRDFGNSIHDEFKAVINRENIQNFSRHHDTLKYYMHNIQLWYQLISSNIPWQFICRSNISRKEEKKKTRVNTRSL